MSVTPRAVRKIWVERLKRWVFKRFLNTDSDDANVTFSDRVFYSRASSTEKNSIADV